MLKCIQCSYVTLDKSNFKKHVVRVHSDKEDRPSEKASFKCLCCTYTTMRSYNFTRHMVTKHPEIPKIPLESIPNRYNPSEQPLESMPNRYIPCHEPLKSIDSSELKCSDCGHIFKRKTNLIVHQSKNCRGVSDVNCKYCKKEFASVKSRWNHEKICKVIPDDETVSQDQPPLSSQYRNQTATTINNNNSMNITNNIQNQNNITNNTINLVAFPLEGLPDGRLFYIPPHEESAFLQKIRDISRNNNTPLAIEKAILNLLDIEENRIFRKKDLKNPITYVHTGNGNWEAQQDKRVYNKVISQATNDIVDALETSSMSIKPNRFIKELNEFGGNAHQFVDDEPNELTDEEHQTKKHMKTIERSMKIKAHKEYLQKGIAL